jgi:hypothetical protein
LACFFFFVYGRLKTSSPAATVEHAAARTT